MKKVIMPGTINNQKMHVEICYEKGRLSITGVVGAMSNGDAKGAAGQCQDGLNDIDTFATGWDREKVKKLLEIWKHWHLNDMRPECEHQRALGWKEKAKEEVIMYRYKLTREAYAIKTQAEKMALTALKNGETFTPTKKQALYASLPYSKTTYTPVLEYYELYETEKKMLGWLKPDEHPNGLLTAKCPVCGYEYGTKWLKEEIPSEVIAWLEELPQASTPCPWGW